MKEREREKEKYCGRTSIHIQLIAKFSRELYLCQTNERMDSQQRSDREDAKSIGDTIEREVSLFSTSETAKLSRRTVGRLFPNCLSSRHALCSPNTSVISLISRSQRTELDSGKISLIISGLYFSRCSSSVLFIK